MVPGEPPLLWKMAVVQVTGRAILGTATRLVYNPIIIATAVRIKGQGQVSGASLEWDSDQVRWVVGIGIAGTVIVGGGVAGVYGAYRFVFWLRKLLVTSRNHQHRATVFNIL